MSEFFSITHLLILMCGACVGLVGACLLVAARDNDEPRAVGFCATCERKFYTSYSMHQMLYHEPNSPAKRKVSGGLWL